MDLAIYGPHKSAAVFAFEQEQAAPWFRLSEIGNTPIETLAFLAAKNVPYTHLFTKAHWHEIAFKSFNGVYGRMNVFAPSAYYVWILILQSGLFGWLFTRGMITGGPRIRILLAATVAATLAVVAASSTPGPPAFSPRAATSSP